MQSLTDWQANKQELRRGTVRYNNELLTSCYIDQPDQDRKRVITSETAGCNMRSLTHCKANETRVGWVQ